MKRVLTAVILIPLVVLALFKAPLWLFTLLVLGVALLAAREYFGIAKATGFRPFEAIGYFFLISAFTAVFYIVTFSAGSSDPAIASAFVFFAVVVIPLTAPFIFLVAGLRRESLSQTLPDAAVTFMAYPYIGVTLLSLFFIRSNDGSTFLLFLMLIVWAGDIAAYYVGRAFGKHRLAPRISPGKTWEGAIASVVSAAILGVLLFHYANPIANAFRDVHLLERPSAWGHTLAGVAPRFRIEPMWFVALFAVCVNISAQLGDLVESALKRGAGLKDSGTLLPGHGGVLDRIDALLFALPVGLLFYAFGISRYFAPGVLY